MTADRIVSWLLAASLAAVASPVAAQSPVSSVDGYVTVAQGFWQHGLSQNDGTSVLLGIDFQHHRGWFVGAWAASVDFIIEQTAARPRDVATNVYAGYHRRSGRWSWTATLGHYAYPGAAVDYDYDTLSATVGFNDRVYYTATYSDAFYSGSRSALSQEVSVAWPLRADVEIGAAIGRFALGSGGIDVDHWNVGVSKLVRRFAVDLRYYDSDYDRLGFLGNRDPRNVVLSVSYALRGKRPRD